MYLSLSGKDLLPSSWIFNDFGHTTIKYAKDNGNVSDVLLKFQQSYNQ